ncbi:anhydro-N-acetylmuramic acid kinase [Algoriphagus sp. CAU 1675]|uniref:anhydro-N-acetylmuramic acid kinase n=1 Tax=Algoriphagus sp. CAU 1675 TaxID=3032597 RepID=UPI0023DC45FC|nr:anhydro-N-acetylmuramic acid kinase [Algoriphagus sp. CAU 1675]MDF2156313.1 anhydro-N-acetylmuramic acid kinase [Algoriphagus sp. CAU 1675]
MSSIIYQAIGLMSGTSGDGLDIAFCEFELTDKWAFRILNASTVPFPEALKKSLMHSHELSALDLAVLDVEFGKWTGTQVKAFCEKIGKKPEIICSHGHTVFHQPSKGISLQIGNGWAIHQASGMKVINDFRMLDVQLGGQGAPLVPIGDRLLFSDMDFCLNLGGISNVSMEHQGKRIAFDCSPFNLLLNPIARELGREYDDGGQWASEGKVNLDLLEKLNALSFYKVPSAKSLGREDIERDFEPLLQDSEIPLKDLLCTLVEHYAMQIAAVIKRYQSQSNPRVLITGGGAYHLYFINRLDFHLQGAWEHFPASSQIIEFKEALVFAFLGVLRLREESNCLASVTGASSDSCGGVIYG